MNELKGTRALVTGGSRGIGAAIALRLAANGADVAITYNASSERAAEVVRRIEALGRKALAIRADSADAAAVRTAVKTAAEALGGLEILVNNAGIALSGPVESQPLEDIEALLDVNVKGVIVASQAAIPYLKEGGRIISIGSCLGQRVAFPGVAVYAATKAALLAFTQGLARELGPKGVTVNVVQPGPVDTDMNPADGEFAPAMRAAQALGRYGDVEDIAGMVAFLAGPQGRYATGAAFTLDGGMNA
jgi:NAD(P)-dependent dehydrogenase (short-subunit alcohol dehydrogenase family)